MKQCGGVWLPDGETHLVDWMKKRDQRVGGVLTYQFHKLEAALAWVTAWRCAVDIGAHCGLWSMHLARRFQLVEAFEPVAEFRECFDANLRAGPRTWNLQPYALGERCGSVAIAIDPASTGGSYIKGEGELPMRRLDDCLMEDLPVDFLKIDCEGYELFALRGGERTLKRWKPCIVVEQKAHKLGPNFGMTGTPAVDYLRTLGAVVRKEMGGDYIMSWPPAD